MMQRDKPTPTMRPVIRGFTLIEVVFVVVIIALLAAVALPLYSSYLARSQASELALKYDAIRTNIQVAAKSGEVQTACAEIASTVQVANLQSDYTQLAVDFEPAVGGFTPVLTMCASLTNQGPHGVDVTREAYKLLSRNSPISPGAVIGDSAVSFSVKLVGDTPLCKTLPPAGAAKGGCTPVKGSGTPPNGVVPVTPASGPASQPAKPPAITPSQAVIPASATVPQAVQSGGRVCPAVAPQQVSRPVMRFGRLGTGAVYNISDLNTNGDMRVFSAEVVVVGESTTGNSPAGSTLLSYSSQHLAAEFSLWNPKSMHITFAGSEFDTGVNIDDRQSHRITVSWQSSTGVLVLFDNGQQVWQHQNINRGGTIGGSGRLVIGQNQSARNGGAIGVNNGYTGRILSASLGNQAVTATQVISGPLANVLQGGGLVTNVIMNANGQPVDTTGGANYNANGDIGAQNAMVDTSVFVDTNCK